MARPEYPIDLEHRADRRCHVSRVVLPNGTVAATSDPELVKVYARAAYAMWQMWAWKVAV